MKRHLFLAIAAIVAALSGPAAAVQPDEILKNPVLEARARDISKNLRCLVCQNQSIDDSDAGLARDLRVLVRERLLAGDSDAQIIDFVVARYGEFVLLKPPFKAATFLLWFGPAVLGGIGIVSVVVFFRRRSGPRRAPAPRPLTPAERRRLDEILRDADA